MSSPPRELLCGDEMEERLDYNDDGDCVEEDYNFSTPKKLEELLEMCRKKKNHSPFQQAHEATKVKDSVQQNSTKSDSKKSDTMADKEKLIGHYLQLLGEKHKLQEHHSMLQMKVIDQLRKKKTDDDAHSFSTLKAKDSKEQEEMKQRYSEELASYNSMRQEAQLASEKFHSILSQKNEECQNQRNQLVESKEKYRELKKNTINQLVQDNQMRNELDKLLSIEEEKEKELEVIRLRNIRLKIQVKKLETIIRSKDQVCGSMNILDFEQLKVENQANNERIEEKNEEILKLRIKISANLRALTHYKEKLHFVEEELKNEKENLCNAEKELAQIRDELSRMKRARDTLRKTNCGMKASAGLLDNENLLRDFEECSDAHEQMRNSLDQLKRTYSSLMTQVKSM